MLKSLRARLTAWFVGLTMILYALGGFCAMVVFEKGLIASVDEGLQESLVEIRPSIEYAGGIPSLRPWAEKASRERLSLLYTVQLFDTKGALIEEYGPAGVAVLANGMIKSDEARRPSSVRSSYEVLDEAGVRHGYLQVQISTRHRDEAVRHFGLTLVAIAPFLAIGVGVVGYWFAGKAVRPIEETLQVLRRFVADAGHELNTPIAIIEGGLETLKETVAEQEVDLEAVDMIGRAAERMKNLSSDLVFLSKIESPEQAFRKAPIPLSEVVASLIDEFQALAKSKRIELTAELPDSLSVIGHADSLRRMFSNLLDNAIRYTEPGGAVHISARGLESDIIVTVEDTGIGIPQDSIASIFDRFYRVDKSRSRAAGGSGLGLSIVKAVVEAHGGSVKAESTLGQGSRFTVVLPGRIGS